MKLSISQILSESAEDFKKLITNPTVLILFLISSILSIIPSFIPEDSPLLALVVIPVILLTLFLYAYQLKLIYNLKKGENSNILPEVSSIYLRYLWYTLIFAGMLIIEALSVAVPAAVVYFTVGNQSVWIIVLAIVVYIPVTIYLSIRLFFYTYLIILEKDRTPLATSWNMTKKYLGSLALLFITLVTIVMLVIIPLYLVLSLTMNMKETTIDVVLLPVNIILGIYMSIAFLNTFLFYRSQDRVKEIKEEILAGNE